MVEPAQHKTPLNLLSVAHSQKKLLCICNLNGIVWFCLRTGHIWEAASPVEMLHEGYMFSLRNECSDKT